MKVLRILVSSNLDEIRRVRLCSKLFIRMSGGVDRSYAEIL